MPDAKVSNELSLVEARKRALRGLKRIKAASTRRKLNVIGARAKRGRPLIKGKVAAVRPVLAPGLRQQAPVVRKLPALPPELKGMRRVKGLKELLPLTRAVSAMRPAQGSVTTWKDIELIPVISSNVASYGYSEEQQLLIVQFLDGSIYEYYDVPKSTWMLMETAPSKGHAVWQYLRDRFPYQRVA